MKKTLLLISLLVLVLSMLVACGGGAEEAPAPAPAQPVATQPPAAPAMPVGDAAKGKEAFATCAGCHGPDAKGLPGLGKDMTTSVFISGQTDEQLMAFIKTGRPASDPANTTGVDMPGKGGNPALTDQQIMDVIAYMRTLQK